MNHYDVKCPICSTINRNLYLDETDGWMECEKCHQITRSLNYKTIRKLVPVFTPDKLVKLFGQPCTK